MVEIIADQYGLINRRLARNTAKKTPASMESYDAILRFYQYETLLTPEAFRVALTALERTVENDPNYGLAWAMLGHLCADNYALGFCDMEAPLEAALAFAKKRVALAPEDQFAWDALTLVCFHKGDKKQFLKSVVETVPLNPNAPYIMGVAGWPFVSMVNGSVGVVFWKKGWRLTHIILAGFTSRCLWIIIARATMKAQLQKP